MTFKLSPLPYAQSALEPAITARTMEFHYGKHHAGYVDKLNKLVQGTPLARLPLDEIIQRTARDRNATAVFNNAAQVWNHDFFWRSMTPDGGGSPDGALGRQIAADFGSFDDFAKQFATQATGLFGSGWIWLVAGADGLRIVIDGGRRSADDLRISTRCSPATCGNTPTTSTTRTTAGRSSTPFLKSS